MFRRRKLSQRIYRVAAMFGSVARQLRLQSKNMEKQAERKFQRVKELMKKGFVDVAKEEAKKVLTFKKRAIEFDIFAEDLKDISAALMGLGPLDEVRRTLEKGVKIVGKLADRVNIPAVADLFGELRMLMGELGVTMEALGEAGGMADVVAEPFSEDEVSEVLEKAALEIGEEIPVPEVEGLEERLKKLREKGE